MVAGSSQPALGAIRLAWWREQLERLDHAGPPAEPRLRQVAAELLPRGIAGAELAALEDCWLPLLTPFPWDSAVADGLRQRGRILFAVAARLLGQPAEPAAGAGELWALADAVRHCSDADSRRFLREECRGTLAALRPARIARPLRPVTIAAALAADDLFPGRAGRGWAALRHQLSGRFPAAG